MCFSETVAHLHAPPHLYGVLAQHRPGCRLLLEKNCAEPLLATLKQGRLRTESEKVVMKAAVLALGHIGSSGIGVLRHDFCKDRAFPSVPWHS
jgi:hypothetical protein